MALIIRIDVDRPYGRSPLSRHLLSRLSSDLYFPRISKFGYLAELRTMLQWLNAEGARSYAFFRLCTLPCKTTLELLDTGGHAIGLHLENSRSYETFCREKHRLEQHVQRKVLAISKHGSGGAKYGLHHYAPYEPERYVDWASRASMRLFLGNLEDPTLESKGFENHLRVFPSAFWLEPFWRDTKKFDLNWLLEYGQSNDVVLLVHPENVLADEKLSRDFKTLIHRLQSKILS